MYIVPTVFVVGFGSLLCSGLSEIASTHPRLEALDEAEPRGSGVPGRSLGRSSGVHGAHSIPKLFFRKYASTARR
jgi:hypothetical protein